MAVLLLLTSGAAAGPQETGGDEPIEGIEVEPMDEPEPTEVHHGPNGGSAGGDFPIEGILRVRTRHRATDDDDDHDVYASTSISFGDDQRHRFTGHVNAYMAADIDDTDDGEFFDTADTYDDQVDLRLYEAYVDVNRIDGLEQLRLGRQQMWTTPVFVGFDGLFVETEPFTDRDLQLGAYAGIPVHHFESSSDGDFLGGWYADARPWEDGRARVDYQRLEDDTRIGDSKNDLWTFALWQVLQDGLDVQGEYTLLDTESLDYRVTANLYDKEKGTWNIRASWYELSETKGLLANEVDPYFNSLLEQFPYTQITVLASKNFDDDILLQGGVDVRDLDESGDEGEFNREFERYQASIVVLGVGREDLDFTLTTEFWESDDNDIQTWGADLTSPLGETFEASIGSYYSLYKYDYLGEADEKDDVRTYYLTLEREQTENLVLDLDYEFETNDFDDYHTLRLGLTWRF